VEPASGGVRGIFRLPFTRDKDKTVTPPQAEAPAAAPSAG
jgi:outer membrane protein assembly factor BamD